MKALKISLNVTWSTFHIFHWSLCHFDVAAACSLPFMSLGKTVAFIIFLFVFISCYNCICDCPILKQYLTLCCAWFVREYGLQQFANFLTSYKIIPDSRWRIFYVLCFVYCWHYAVPYRVFRHCKLIWTAWPHKSSHYWQRILPSRIEHTMCHPEFSLSWKCILE